MPTRRSRPAPRFLFPVFRAMAVLAVLASFAAFASARASDSVLDQAMARVFVVRSADTGDRFLGSAFLWTEGHVAVTNAHVVGEAQEVRLIDQQGTSQIGRVIGRDRVRDVAVIAVVHGMAGLQPGPIPALGEPVWALGAPLGLDFTLTRGMVSAQARQVEAAVPLRLLQHDAAVNPGSSGGPLIDAAGRVVGMNSRIADGSRHFIGIAFAITAPDLERLVQGLIDGSLPPVPDLGLLLRPVSRQIAAALGVAPGGILVDRVKPGGLADRAGLQPGDVIEATAGVALDAPGDLAFALERAVPGGALMLGLRRDGVSATATLTFDHAPDVLARPEADSAAPTSHASYRLAALGVKLDALAGVTEVTDNSPALFAGLAVGDRILRLNGQAMDAAALNRFDILVPVLILIARNGGATAHLILDPWDKGGGLRPTGGANVLDPDVVVF